MSDMNERPHPIGELSIQTVAMPKDTNANGDIFGGWLLSQMDTAGAIAAAKVAEGRVATVAIDSMSFLVPVKVGNVVSCYTNISQIGRSSIQVEVEVWMTHLWDETLTKVTEGSFVFVAIDNNGLTRIIPS